MGLNGCCFTLKTPNLAQLLYFLCAILTIWPLASNFEAGDHFKELILYQLWDISVCYINLELGENNEVTVWNFLWKIGFSEKKWHFLNYAIFWNKKFIFVASMNFYETSQVCSQERHFDSVFYIPLSNLHNKGPTGHWTSLMLKF